MSQNDDAPAVARARAILESKRDDLIDMKEQDLDEEKDPLLAVAAGQFKPLKAANIKPRRVFSMPEKTSAVDWHPDGKHLATCTQNGKIIIWNGYTSNKESLIFKANQFSSLMSCAWSPDGNVLAVGGLDNVVTLYKNVINDPSAGADQKPTAVLEKHMGYISGLHWWSNSSIMSSSSDGSVLLWDASKMVSKQSWNNGVEVSALGVQRKGNLFLCGSNDTSVQMYDKRQKYKVASFIGCNSAVNDVRWSPNNNTFATFGEDGVVKIFDLRAQRSIQTLAVAGGEDQGEDDQWGEGTSATCGDFGISGRLLFVGYSNAIVLIWDCVAGEIVQKGQLFGHKEHVTGCRVSPNGKGLVTTGRDKMIHVWA